MAKIKVPNVFKYKGRYYKAGTVIEVPEQDLKYFPETCIIKQSGKEEDDLSKMTEDELYNILQKLQVPGRTKIRNEGKAAMIEVIRARRE